MDYLYVSLNRWKIYADEATAADWQLFAQPHYVTTQLPMTSV